MEEIWKDVKGYEGIYKISNRGNIKSIDRISKAIRKNKIISQKFKGQALRPFISTTGYFTIKLTKNNNYKSFKIHRLIAIHFIPNPDNKAEVNHIDGNKLNNDINNLEWATHLKNMRHAFSTGLVDITKYSNMRVGEKNGNSKLTDSEAKLIKQEIYSNNYT